MIKFLHLVPVLLSFAVHAQAFESRFEPVDFHESTKVRKEILSDGSICWIKSSKVDLDLSHKIFSGKQLPRLDRGEVLFEGSKDTIQLLCDPLTVTALSNFSVSSYKKKIEMVILTGSVTVNTGEEKRIVERGKTVIYNRKKENLEIRETRKGKLRSVTVGTSYNMSFVDAPVTEMAKAIESKFDVKLVIYGATSGQLITVDLSGVPLEDTIDLMATLIGKAYEIDGKYISMK